MDGPAEAEVTAETDGDAVDMAEFPLDREEVRQGLRRVAVGAVAGVDDRHGRYFRGVKLRTLDVVAHGDDVGEAADHADGILHALTLGDGTAPGIGEAEHVAAEFHHGGGETQPRTGTGLVKEGRKFLMRHAALVTFAVGDDILGQRDDFVDLGLGEVGRVDEVFHVRVCGYYLIQLSSEGLSRKARMRSFQPGPMRPSSSATSTRTSRLHKEWFSVFAAAMRSRPRFIP